MHADRQVPLSQGPVEYYDTGPVTDGSPTLLFVHGILANGRLWGRVVPVLEDDARYRCVVPDWPLGSHRLAMRNDADLTPPGLVRLIVEFLDVLKLDRVVLVGNDTGGALCQMVAADYPDRVDALVLTPCDAYENFPPPALFVVLRLASRLPGGLAMLAQTMRFRLAWKLPISLAGLAKHPIERDLVDAWFGPSRRNRAVRRDAAKVIRAVDKRYTLAAADKLKVFRKPALIAWAPGAPHFPFSDAERLAADLPDARLTRIDDSYAFVSLDQPRATADAIRTFLG